MPDAFTQDPRSDVAVAALVASNNAVGFLAGATANIPLAMVADAAGQPPATAKQQVITSPASTTNTPIVATSSYTTATCPVEKKVVAKVAAGNGKLLPLRCPLCGYEKLTYS